MQPPYSTRFIGARGATTDQTYTVPAGKLAIASCLDVYGNMTGLADLFFHNAAGGTIFWETWNPGDRKSVGWRGHQVYVAGETMTVAISVGSLDQIDITLSGYLLNSL